MKIDINETKFDKEILIEKIEENNKIIKYSFNTIMLLGAFSFLIVGISSYINYNLIPFLKADDIIFFPQGITMCLYGIAGTILSINQFKILLLKVGEGYNEFNKKNGNMTIFRKGTQDNSDIKITYALKDIEAIKIEIKTDLFNNKQNIFVCIKNKNDIPIIQYDNPIKINELEEKASEIASFLKVPVKGI
uniref:photosystem I assembly protein Ycf4 n=1 Tax=Euglena deses TaxID=66845 RepID=UPI0023AA5170|nr:photosystem I assembly protein Ycf4 [Euglena deses]WCH63353.1 photosystem I assembly protein Ycf4 [Euglena deses]